MISRSKVDRLGERLKRGHLDEDDLRLLDEYRRTASDAYELVVGIIRDLGLAATGRPAKSTPSIVDKLRRESCRLSQMQDIAGCRIVVDTIADQDRVASQVRAAFRDYGEFDRRTAPSHGYRAVHFVVRSAGNVPIEIQLRSALQHRWAEYSEKLSDVFGPTVKYGGGPDDIRMHLAGTSELVCECEDFEVTIQQLEEQFRNLDPACLGPKACHESKHARRI